MITNILDQSFTDFAKTVLSPDEEKVVQNPQRQRLDTLSSYYTDRVSANETELITKYANSLVSGGQPHTPDPRLYMRRDLLGLVQDSYALGIADALVDLEDVQFSYKKTSAEFALSPDDKLQRDINKLQRDIQASQNIVRQTETLNQYTNTLQTLQNQAQALNNIQATQTLGQLSQQLQTLKTGNTARTAIRVVNQQLQKGGTQQQQAQATVNQQIAANGQPNTQDYLVKRAIEEKLKYLQNRKDSLADTPPVVLDEDKDFFRWYADKRLVPIANRYQQTIADKNNEAKDIATKYTEEINKGTTTQAAKGDYTDKIVRKLLNIEDSSKPSPKDKQRPIKRVQRVVATELAIAYNVGRLKAYMKAGIQYVTISTSMYSNAPCTYCLDTEAKTKDNPISIASLLKRAYKNEGFDKNLNRPIEQRYLVHHPFCFCFYKPHPRKDPEEKDGGDSTGIYADPNTWKFILGAGLGVSLVFLAFALTSGRKISAPTIKPPVTPTVIEQPVLPIGAAVRSIEAEPPVAGSSRTETVTADPRQPFNIRQEDLERILRDPDVTDRQRELIVEGLQNITTTDDRERMTQLNNLLERVVGYRPNSFIQEVGTQAARGSGTAADIRQATRGTIQSVLYNRYDRFIDRFERTNTYLGNQFTQQRIQQRVEEPVIPSEARALKSTLSRTVRDLVSPQIKEIQDLRSELEYSLSRTRMRRTPTQEDLDFITGLQVRLETLRVTEARLQQLRRDLQNVSASIQIIRVTPVQLRQQIAQTRSLVDRLEQDATLVTQAQEQYEALLSMLDLYIESGYVARPYTKSIQDLNRRIRNAQGLELKRFTGGLVTFAKYNAKPFLA